GHRFGLAVMLAQIAGILIDCPGFISRGSRVVRFLVVARIAFGIGTVGMDLVGVTLGGAESPLLAFASLVAAARAAPAAPLAAALALAVAALLAVRFVAALLAGLFRGLLLGLAFEGVLVLFDVLVRLLDVRRVARRLGTPLLALVITPTARAAAATATATIAILALGLRLAALLAPAVTPLVAAFLAARHGRHRAAFDDHAVALDG